MVGIVVPSAFGDMPYEEECLWGLRPVAKNKTNSLQYTTFRLKLQSFFFLKYVVFMMCEDKCTCECVAAEDAEKKVRARSDGTSQGPKRKKMVIWNQCAVALLAVIVSD